MEVRGVVIKVEVEVAMEEEEDGVVAVVVKEEEEKEKENEEKTVEMVIVVNEEEMAMVMVANYWAIYLHKMTIKFGFVCILSPKGQNTSWTTVLDRGGGSKLDTIVSGEIIPCL